MSAASSDDDVPGILAPQRVAIGILGPMVIGWVLNLWLSGVAFTTFYDYFQRGKLVRDSLFAKIISISTLVLNTWTGIYCGYALFYWSTTQKRTSVELWSQTTLDCLQPLWIGLIGFLVQLWFARRCTMLFQGQVNRRIFIGCVGLFMFCSLGGAVGNVYANFLYANGIGSVNIQLIYAATNSSWLLSASVVDCLNCTTLYYLLKRHVAGFNLKTDSVLKKTIKLSLETGCYTATFSSVAAIISLTTNVNSYYTSDINYAFFSPLPSLYAIGLFTTMASRDDLAKEIEDSPKANYRPATVVMRRPSHFHRDSPASRHGISFVNVEVNVVVKEDIALEGDEESGTQWERIKERRDGFGTSTMMSQRPDQSAFKFLT